MLPVHVALTSLTDEVPPSQLRHVAAALQTQALRDVAPIWSVSATVDAFDFSELPAGYWPLVVVKDLPGPGHGLHVMKDRSPLAFVRNSASWSLTASHEMIEMIVDPGGNRTTPGRSWEEGQGQVDFLVEACDPCEDGQFAYTINGVLVSDFVTPRFYDPFQTSGARYSMGGNVEGPRMILENGYLSWRDPRSGDIWQRRWEGGRAVNKRLGPAEFTSVLSMRAWVDERTPNAQLEEGLDPEAEPLSYAARWFAEAAATARARAEELRREIEDIYEGGY
jgi:hypothetical protein